MPEKQFKEFVIFNVNQKNLLLFSFPLTGNLYNSAAVFPLTRSARKETGGNTWEGEELQVGGVQLRPCPKKSNQTLLEYQTLNTQL